MEPEEAHGEGGLLWERLLLLGRASVDEEADREKEVNLMPGEMVKRFVPKRKAGTPSGTIGRKYMPRKKLT